MTATKHVNVNLKIQVADKVSHTTQVPFSNDNELKTRKKVGIIKLSSCSQASKLLYRFVNHVVANASKTRLAMLASQKQTNKLNE